MTKEIIGYYNDQKKGLLKDFDESANLMSKVLRDKYGEEFSKAIPGEIRGEFEKLIPEIPYIVGVRGKMLNNFIIITAQLLATYKAIIKHGKTPGEIWELCDEVIKLKMDKVPLWKLSLMKKIWSSRVITKVVEKRSRKKKRDCLGNFEIEYLVGDGKDFDYGVNYFRCSNYEFLKKHGGEDFAPYICMTDIVLSNYMGWGLIRTQTLADGCDYCDFRFKKGAATQVTSKTPDVQATIYKIYKS